MNAKLLLLITACLLSFGSAKAQAISSAAGNGINGFMGDGGPATQAEFNHPLGVAFDLKGNAYIADANNNRIRKIDAQGIITTFAGTGIAGYSGDGKQATAAKLSFPSSVACDRDGNVYVADEENSAIRKINPEGIITTIAGNGIANYSGDNGPAKLAQLDDPTGIAFDAKGNLYIADYGNNRVRKIDKEGIITTIAGTGTAGFSGDGGPGTLAMLDSPVGIACDASGCIYIADENNNCIRKINAEGIISTFAGNGNQEYAGDGGKAIAASFFWPAALAFDAKGDLYIADEGNAVVRKIDKKGIITTFAGNEKAHLNEPVSIAFDAVGNMYITDELNSMVCRNFKH